MNHLKLVSAIIVALCVTGLEAKPLWIDGAVSAGSFCNYMMRNGLLANAKADVEKTFARAERYVSSRFSYSSTHFEMARRLKPLLAAVIHRSNCDESSLDVVDTMVDCAPWRSKSTKWLDEATKEYARRCLTPDQIRDKVNSTISSFGAMKVTQFLDHQFFVDYESEIPEKHLDQIMNGKIFDGKFSKALAKAVIRDLKEDFGKLKNQTDVFDYLKERLFKPCFVFNKATREVLKPLLRARFYIEGYEKIISSLDENAREQIFRTGFCQQFYPQTRQETFSGLVLRDLESASA